MRSAGEGLAEGRLQAQRALDVGEAVEVLPGELLVAAAEVAVGGGAAVDRLAQVEVADDGGRPQVEDLVDHASICRGIDGLGAERLHHDRHRPGHADGVGDLDLAPAGGARGHDVLGHPAGGVGGRAVDLRRVLAREGTPAVAGGAAVGVDDDLAPGEAGVGVGPAEHEAAGGVGQQLVLVVGELLGQQRVDHVLPQVGLEQGLDVEAGLVLAGDEHRLQADGPAVLVLERDLGLAVGPQVGQHARLAHLGQPLGQPVGQPDRQRHEVFGLVAGVAEHHPLVAGALGADLVLAAGALAHLVGGGDALADVGRLLVDGGDDPARVAVEAVRLPVVADGAHRLADDLGDVDVGPGGDLARHHDQAGGEQRLARHPSGGVLGQDGVEDGVGDLVGHLVGMAFGDRLRGERVVPHG